MTWMLRTHGTCISSGLEPAERNGSLVLRCVLGKRRSKTDHCRLFSDIVNRLQLYKVITSCSMKCGVDSDQSRASRQCQLHCCALRNDRKRWGRACALLRTHTDSQTGQKGDRNSVTELCIDAEVSKVHIVVVKRSLVCNLMRATPADAFARRNAVPSLTVGKSWIAC